MQENNQSFRDRPVILDEKTGKSKRIHAKQPKGKWYKRRTLFAWFCIAFLIFAPIIKINGNPLMLFDIANRRFSLFGNIVWAQDTFILALIMLVTVIGIVLFTVVFGRLWCGWACPQTIFLEMVYRRIEYFFEGDLRSKKEYSASSRKLRKIGKHISFLIVSFGITNIFIMWFTGPEKLLAIMSAPISEYRISFLFMLAISLFYYWVYSYLREQICTFFCPYGRLQGVLLDSKSISVIYDFKRGEPRGTRHGGDCVNCGQCIAVCPTGIDIRNGSQLECINCSACIDECNIIMKKVKKPANLIRFDSVQGVKTGKRSIANARTYAYSAVMLVLLAVLGFTVADRSVVDVSIQRMPGTISQAVDSVTVQNIYNVKIINKSQKNKQLQFKLMNVQSGILEFTSTIGLLKGEESQQSVLMIKIPSKVLSEQSTELKIGVFDNDKLLTISTINFIYQKK